MDIPRNYNAVPGPQPVKPKPDFNDAITRPPPVDKPEVRKYSFKEYQEEMVSALQRIEKFLPESTRPYEVAQIVLEFADALFGINTLEPTWFPWRAMSDEEKAETFIVWYRDIYSKRGAWDDPENH